MSRQVFSLEAIRLAKQGRQVATAAAQDLIWLGTLAPELADVEQIVDRRRAHVYRVGEPLPEGGARDDFYRQNDLLKFKDYCQAVRNGERWRRELRRKGTLDDTSVTFCLDQFLLKHLDLERHSADLAGWINYLCDVTPAFADHVGAIEKPALLPEAPRRMHTLISAASGWGKSELLKALVHHYVERPSAAVVVLDPHGDMVGQIARFPEFQENRRLVYVEPGLAPDMTVGLNPLDGRGLDEEAVALTAAQLATTIGELVAELTPNMATLARNCVRVLLEDGGATLYDLATLLEPRPRKKENRPDDPRRMMLVARGQHHPDPTVARFFTIDLESESFDSAKAALRNRISSLLSLPAFQAMTCGPATLHLSTLLEQRKVILVNLGPLGSEGGAAMGRLTVGMVAAIGRRRERQAPADRVPCHVFVDEAATMVSPAMGRILAELRKYGVHLTLAQQVAGVGFDADGRKILETNTACKLVGSNSRAELRSVFGDSDMKDLPRLQRGQFWLRWGQDGEPQRLQVRSDLADDRHAMPATAWERLAARMVSDYYRPAKSVLPASEAPLTPSPAVAPADADDRLTLPLE